ncbi:MAG: L-histidine N(alpha)-methyltransferase [Acidobacteriales bacterium]|nr:MAG: L-histidine N(alpha)-methyltransferase [Terriglobales bacterium]
MSAQPSTPLALSEFAFEVQAGLATDGQKTLPCRYFYDEVGTALFQAISLLPEYGLTRADDRVIQASAGELADLLRTPVSVVELGSGTGSKTHRILEALSTRASVTYYPIDVSLTALQCCRRELSDVAEVVPVEASYLEGVTRAVSLRKPRERILTLFLGSTIGNFERSEMPRFLQQVRARLRPGDALLLGTDLEKAESRMTLAYDDPQGVTAAFNLNLLARINRELGGDFVIRDFAHEALYNRSERRIEMHLRSRRDQQVFIRDAGIEAPFRRGETIWTESSHKFELPEVRTLAADSGFDCVRQWVDQEWPFAENLLIAGGARV